jgi:hypothetical protein
MITRLRRACGRPRCKSWLVDHGPVAQKVGKMWAPMSRISDAAVASGSRRLYHTGLLSWSNIWYSDAAAAHLAGVQQTVASYGTVVLAVYLIFRWSSRTGQCLLGKMRQEAVEANPITCNWSTSLTPAVSRTHAKSLRNFLRIGHAEFLARHNFHVLDYWKYNDLPCRLAARTQKMKFTMLIKANRKNMLEKDWADSKYSFPRLDMQVTAEASIYILPDV